MDNSSSTSPISSQAQPTIPEKNTSSLKKETYTTPGLQKDKTLTSEKRIADRQTALSSSHSVYSNPSHGRSLPYTLSLLNKQMSDIKNFLSKEQAQNLSSSAFINELQKKLDTMLITQKDVAGHDLTKAQLEDLLTQIDDAINAGQKLKNQIPFFQKIFSNTEVSKNLNYLVKTKKHLQRVLSQSPKNLKGHFQTNNNQDDITYVLNALKQSDHKQKALKKSHSFCQQFAKDINRGTIHFYNSQKQRVIDVTKEREKLPQTSPEKLAQTIEKEIKEQLPNMTDDMIFSSSLLASQITGIIFLERASAFCSLCFPNHTTLISTLSDPIKTSSIHHNKDGSCTVHFTFKCDDVRLTNAPKINESENEANTYEETQIDHLDGNTLQGKLSLTIPKNGKLDHLKIDKISYSLNLP